MGVTEQLAGFVAETRLECIPSKGVRFVKQAILDCLGCALLGSAQPAGRIMAEQAREECARPVATVIGAALRTSSIIAALANGISSHAEDYDDLNLTMSAHASAAMLPAALAVAESRHATGRELIEAYALGFEVACRVGLAANPAHYNREWHATGTLGVLGATMASAKLLGLNKHQIRMALGVAASESCGLRQNFGTMTKAFHAGNAARGGVLAATLARPHAPSARRGRLGAGLHRRRRGAGRPRRPALSGRTRLHGHRRRACGDGRNYHSPFCPREDGEGPRGDDQSRRQRPLYADDDFRLYADRRHLLKKGGRGTARGQFPYGAYRAKDGDVVTVHGQDDHEWPIMCFILGLEHLLEDPRYQSAADRTERRFELYPILDGAFQKKTRAEWSELFRQNRLRCDPCLDYEEVLEHPQTQALDLFARIDHPVRGEVPALHPPMEFSEFPKPERYAHPPILGEHTRDVLSELGFAPEQISELADQGVVSIPSDDMFEPAATLKGPPVTFGLGKGAAGIKK